jgi:hypothetical protein
MGFRRVEAHRRARGRRARLGRRGAARRHQEADAAGHGEAERGERHPGAGAAPRRRLAHLAGVPRLAVGGRGGGGGGDQVRRHHVAGRGHAGRIGGERRHGLGVERLVLRGRARALADERAALLAQVREHREPGLVEEHLEEFRLRGEVGVDIRARCTPAMPPSPMRPISS